MKNWYESGKRLEQEINHYNNYNNYNNKNKEVKRKFEGWTERKIEKAGKARMNEK